MTIKDALIKYRNVEIDILLAHLLGKSKEFIFLHPEARLTRIQAHRLTRMAERRLRGEPVAYILGYKDFCGLRFKVNKDVLVPRPETEGLVEYIVNNVIPAKAGILSKKVNIPHQSLPRTVLRMRDDKIKILDIGTGSGCIIISLAKQLSIKHSALSTKLFASDISTKALKIAKQNAKMILHHHTRLYDGKKIIFVKSDLLEDIKFNPDIIIANLPYGWLEWKNNTSAETAGLKFEPKEALFTQENGLRLIKKLIIQIVERKQKPKLVLLEFDPRQKKELQQMIKKHLPGASAEFEKDFNGLWRYAVITL